MLYIYNFGVWFYVFVIYLVSPFNKKANKWIKGRKHVFAEIADKVNPLDNNVWFHVSSLGEFEQGRPVIEELKKKYPEHKVIVTFFSPSGYEVRKDFEGADAIFYLPMDTPRNAKKFIELVNPKMVFFVKYEFWFHYLNALKKKGIHTYLFSAIFRPQQHFFKWYGGWYRKLLNLFSFIWVQNSDSERLLQSIGIKQVSVGGDTRFDRVFQIAQESKSMEIFDFFCADQKVIVAGSTWQKDEEALLYMLNTLDFDVKLILAPHEIHAGNISRIENLFAKKSIRMSQANAENIRNFRVLIIDNIGLLSSIYKYGHIGYIGGGFGAGIHNTLEAATYGIPVVFGPNYQKFNEAKDLILQNAAFTFADNKQLLNIVFRLFNNGDACKICGQNAIDYVHEMRGGTALVMDKIDP